MSKNPTWEAICSFPPLNDLTKPYDDVLLGVTDTIEIDADQLKIGYEIVGLGVVEHVYHVWSMVFVQIKDGDLVNWWRKDTKLLVVAESYEF